MTYSYRGDKKVKMRILLTDDEELVLEDSLETLQLVFPNAEIETAGDYQTAINKANKLRFDMAFLDIEIPGKTGIELAKELQELNPRINIIFLTAYSQYALDAYKLLASDYLLKPLRVIDIEKTMQGLRYAIEETEAENSLKVICFGKFDAFYKEKQLSFHREKEKELFAYLISQKGISVTSTEICSALWGDDSDNKRNYFWKILSELRKDLRESGLVQVLIDNRDAYAVDIKTINCDYYEYFNQKGNHEWNGLFMEQYGGWAEEIKATLHYTSEVE